jgi:serine/threonine protein phosphatase PrpC
MSGCCAARPPRVVGDGVSVGREPPVVEVGPCAPTVLHTGDAIPIAMRRVRHARSGQTLRVYKSDYPANDPSEDRHSVAIADDSVFAGVWDGHGGNGSCAEYVDEHVYEEFSRALVGGGEPSRAFEQAFAELDRSYTRDAEEGGKLEKITAGTCAVGVHVELSQQGGTVTCGNLGDSRVVYGRWDGDAMLHAAPLSSDHAATNSKERARLRAAFEDMRVVQVVGTQEDYGCGEEDISDLAVLGICRFTRSLGDCHMKTVSSAAAFNSYQAKRQTELQIPIAPLHRAAAQGVGYISNVPETYTTDQPMENGFLIIASDGVWDEMSSSEAVRTVARLLHESKLRETKGDSENGEKQDQQSAVGKVDVAQLFVEEVLKRAAFRIAVSQLHVA